MFVAVSEGLVCVYACIFFVHVTIQDPLGLCQMCGGILSPPSPMLQCRLLGWEPSLSGRPPSLFFSS